MRVMIKIIIAVFAMIQAEYCYTQQYNGIDTIPVKTVYRQKIRDYHESELRLNVSENDMYYIWETVIGHPDYNTILIYRDSLKKDNNKALHCAEHNDSPLHLYTIGGAIEKGVNLYVVYNKFGSVYLANYHFTIDSGYQKKELQLFPTINAADPLINVTHFREIEDCIFLYQASGQNFGDKLSALYSIDPKNFEVKEVVFDEDPKIVAGFCTEDGSGERLMDLKNYDEPTIDEKKELEWLKKYMRKPYYFIKLSKKEEERNKEIASIYKRGFVFYQFDKDFHYILHARKHIFEVLGFAKIKMKRNNYRMFFEVIQDGNNYYFFYQTGKDKKTKIIRYSSDKSYWLISDYKEEKIK